MRLHLLAHAATEASRAARFPLDEALDTGGRRTAGELAGRLREPDLLWCAPSARCRETTALALPGREPDGDAPTGPDPGAWAGRSPADLAAEDPAALQAWMTDAEAGPPGGESLRALVDRVAGWMDDLPGEERAPSAWPSSTRPSSGPPGRPRARGRAGRGVARGRGPADRRRAHRTRRAVEPALARVGRLCAADSRARP